MRFVRRRWRVCLGVFLVLCAASLAVALALPPVYRAGAVLRAEGIAVSEGALGVEALTARWLQARLEQALGREELLSLARRTGVLAGPQPGEDLSRFRRAARAEAIGPKVTGSRADGGTEAVFSVAVSYQGGDREAVRALADGLAVALVQSVPPPQPQAEPAATVPLEKELALAVSKLEAAEAKLGASQKKHAADLSDPASAAAKAVEKVGRELDRLEERASSLQERRRALESKLSATEPVLTVSAESQPPQGSAPEANPKEAAGGLRAEMLGNRGAAEAKAAPRDPRSARLDELKAQLAALRRMLGPNHRDVVKLTQEADALAAEIEAPEPLKRGDPRPAVKKTLPNPAYELLRSQLAEAEKEASGIQAERKRLRAEEAKHRSRAEKTFAAAEEHRALTRQREEAARARDEASARLAEARQAWEAFRNRRVETLEVVERAALPEREAGPNRRAVLLAGVLISLIAALAAGLAREASDKAAKSAEQVMAVTGVPVLIELPLAETSEEKRTRRARRTLWAGACCMSAIAALVIVHQAVAPLDELWRAAGARLSGDAPVSNLAGTPPSGQRR